MDFKNSHLAWLKSTPQFQCKYPQDNRDKSYIEVMTALYAGQSGNHIPQSMAEAMFVADKAWYKKSKQIAKVIDAKVEKLEPTPDGVWFVTCGFNHQTWSVVKCCKFIEKVLAMDWIIRAKANFELYRENGEHPHCHFIIETKEPKSRILEKLLRPQYAKDVILSKNFIDVKVCGDYHHKYINLDKIQDKMKYVEKDMEWRKINNIPNYEKNWN